MPQRFQPEVVTADNEDSCLHKVIRIQKNLFQVPKIGAHQEDTIQKRLRLAFTVMRNFYTYVSNKRHAE